MKARSTLVSVMLLSFAGLAAGGGAFGAEPLKLVTASFMKIDAQIASAKGHPNEEWRLNGLKSYLGGHYEEAITRFEQAASYADKYSEHYLSLIYWYGQGVPVDHVRAYIWSDLAAERGSRPLLAIREKMWEQLTPAQREQAVAQGGEFYAKYGDEVAKPRAEQEIRRFAHQMTGSHIGYRNQMIDVNDRGPIHGSFGNGTPGMLNASVAENGGTTGEKLYADTRVKMTAYWKTQDQELDQAGRVEVGPAKSARESRTP
jgi:hypothetical protein